MDLPESVDPSTLWHGITASMAANALRWRDERDELQARIDLALTLLCEHAVQAEWVLTHPTADADEVAS